VVCHVPLSGEDGFVLTLFRVGFGGIRPRESLILDALYPHLRNLFSARISPAETQSRRIWQVARDGALTPREEEILFCPCRRLSAREIADRLHMSRRTAEKHLENLYAKLRVTSRGEVRAQLLGERENS